MIIFLMTSKRNYYPNTNMQLEWTSDALSAQHSSSCWRTAPILCHSHRDSHSQCCISVAHLPIHRGGCVTQKLTGLVPTYFSFMCQASSWTWGIPTWRRCSPFLPVTSSLETGTTAESKILANHAIQGDKYMLKHWAKCCENTEGR